MPARGPDLATAELTGGRILRPGSYFCKNCGTRLMHTTPVGDGPTLASAVTSNRARLL